MHNCRYAGKGLSPVHKNHANIRPRSSVAGQAPSASSAADGAEKFIGVPNSSSCLLCSASNWWSAVVRKHLVHLVALQRLQCHSSARVASLQLLQHLVLCGQAPRGCKLEDSDTSGSNCGLSPAKCSAEEHSGEPFRNSCAVRARAGTLRRARHFWEDSGVRRHGSPAEEADADDDMLKKEHGRKRGPGTDTIHIHTQSFR